MVELIALNGAIEVDSVTLWWISAIVSNAIIAALIAAVAWAGSRVYRNPLLWHAVWVIALAKLFLPPIWSVPVSLVSDHPRISSAAISTIAVDAESRDATNRDAIDSSTRISPAAATQATQSSTHTEPTGRRRRRLTTRSLISVALPLWAIGSFFALLISGYRIICFHRLVRQSSPADVDTAGLARSLVARLGNDVKQPEIRFVDQGLPPLLWPIGSPATIVLPYRWWQNIARDEQATVLMHELIHWRRRDHWIRLVSWISSIVFWWHPFVWVARREIHQLEEQCCDAEVMHRMPGSGRSYASALLSASQWLDDYCESDLLRHEPLAMPMSDFTQFESFHRRIAMLPNLRHRPWNRRRFIAMMLSAAVPLAISLNAGAQQPEVSPMSDDASGEKQISSKVAGQVTDMEDGPIAGAKIRIVIPSVELRFPSIDRTKYREFWGKTDAEGNYSIDIEGIEKKLTASIDILHPGHQRLVGTLMMGGSPNSVRLSPGESTEFDASLSEALYFAGQVVDQLGKPIAGVEVGSCLRYGSGIGGIEQSVSDAEGRFAVYGYTAKQFRSKRVPDEEEATATISFRHPRYGDVHVEKLEDLEPGKRKDLRVVMPTGHSLAGTVTDSAGAPADGVVLSITQIDPDQRKAMLTDAEGKFRLDGLNTGKAAIRVVDVAGKRKSVEEIFLEASNLEMDIELNSIESPIETTHKVLGMALADVTSEVNEAFELQHEKWKGVMVVDPGPRVSEFEIGELRAGYVFWMVGNERVSNLREMVRQLVKEAKSPTTPPGANWNTSAIKLDDGQARVRVVYTVHNEHGFGTNTQYMHLTSEDIDELEELNEAYETTGEG